MLQDRRARFDANLAALDRCNAPLAGALRALRPAFDYALRGDGESTEIARKPRAATGPFTPLPAAVSPETARQILSRLTAQSVASGPLLVAGVDLGWLWDTLYRAPIDIPAAPGHRPPLYLLCRDLEPLWLALHLHDWPALLTDPRCVILVGDDAVAQLKLRLVDTPQVPWPKVNLTIDPTVWPVGCTLDALLRRAETRLAASAERLIRSIDTAYAGLTPVDFARRLRNGARQPLRVLGIVSRFTTFLQHSMRDWLAGFESLGHQTRLVIESADHEKLHPITYLRAFDEFRPDLVLLIDHYRAEFPLMPQAMPAVMWIQDRLPNIFRSAAGEAQGANDYVIGYGRRDCVTDFAYPRARFMDAPVGVNERRFAAPAGARRTTPACEVAFVSHASTPADELARGLIAQQSSPAARALLADVHARLSEIYARGESVTQEFFLHRLIEQSMSACGVRIDDMGQIVDLVTNRLNNALFRHQVIEWLADAGVDLHLYGNGWERHPRFARYARGVADNQTRLAEVFRSAAINLQVTPFGAAHQRLFEGLCAGGFFLLRRVTGDLAEPAYVELHRFVQSHDIRDDDALRALARQNERVDALLHHVESLTGQHPLAMRHDFVDALRAAADGGFVRAASTLWPDDYPAVSFDNRDELLQKVRHFLAHPDQRQRLVDRMRRRVLETVTYTGISRRMLRFIADDLADRARTGASPARALEAAA